MLFLSLNASLLPIYLTLSTFPRTPLEAKKKHIHNTCLHRTTKSQETWKIIYMAMDLELDDDVFFADISKQISLLIMDEDEHLNSVSLSSSSSLSFQDLFRGGGYQMAPYMYHQEQSKGTGVFIPKASQPRRRQQHHHHQKQGRFSSFNAKQQHSLLQNRQEYQQNHENSRSTHINNTNNKSIMNSGSIPRRTYRDPTSIYS